MKKDINKRVINLVILIGLWHCNEVNSDFALKVCDNDAVATYWWSL